MVCYKLSNNGTDNKFRHTEKILLLEKFLNVGEKRTLLYNILRIKANWIGQILRINCPLHDPIKG